LSDFVLDASVVVKWFLPEPHAEAARRLRSADLAAKAPDLLLLEVPNVLWKYVMRGVLALKTAQEAIEALAIAPINLRTAESLFTSAFRLATETRRSVYDCTYLSLAIEEDCPLVTADRKFYDAIKAGPFAECIVWVGDLNL
jgi:predicted nucleic acid-binding protein